MYVWMRCGVFCASQKTEAQNSLIFFIMFILFLEVSHISIDNIFADLTTSLTRARTLYVRPARLVKWMQ